MTSIELRNLTVADPGGRPLLDDISLQVPSGSTLAIIGPSGAGKSLLLNVLVGLTAVSYTHLRAPETVLDLVCRLLLEKTQNNNTKTDSTTHDPKSTTQQTLHARTA